MVFLNPSAWVCWPQGIDLHARFRTTSGGMQPAQDNQGQMVKDQNCRAERPHCPTTARKHVVHICLLTLMEGQEVEKGGVSRRTLRFCRTQARTLLVLWQYFQIS